MSNGALEDLLAKQAITEVIYKYTRGLDRMDRDLSLSVWHPGGTADYGDMFKGTGAGFIDWVFAQHAAMIRHSHQMTNILIELDGTKAASETYIINALRTQPRPGRIVDIITRGRYLDRWSRRDGVWAIDHRHYVHEFQSSHDVSAADHADSMKTPARRDRQDPSYALFEGL